MSRLTKDMRSNLISKTWRSNLFSTKKLNVGGIEGLRQKSYWQHHNIHASIWSHHLNCKLRLSFGLFLQQGKYSCPVCSPPPWGRLQSPNTENKPFLFFLPSQMSEQYICQITRYKHYCEGPVKYLLKHRRTVFGVLQLSFVYLLCRTNFICPKSISELYQQQSIFQRRTSLNNPTPGSLIHLLFFYSPFNAIYSRLQNLFMEFGLLVCLLKKK